MSPGRKNNTKIQIKIIFRAEFELFNLVTGTTPRPEETSATRATIRETIITQKLRY